MEIQWRGGKILLCRWQAGGDAHLVEHLGRVVSVRRPSFGRLRTGLGSTSLATNAYGYQTSRLAYKPFGGTAWFTAALPTDYGFTGQRFEATPGYIYDFGGRYYDEYIGRFISADSIVPGAGNPQALNRYSYTFNNPLRYTDPSGHCPWCGDFIKGFLYQMGYNANPLPSGYVGAADALAVQPNESDAMLVGRLAGSVGSIALSYAEVVVGGAAIDAGVGGGLLTCAETLGAGCVAGAGVTFAGAGLVAEGYVQGAKAVGSAVNTASILMAKGKSSDPSSIDPKNPKGQLTKNQKYAMEKLGLSKEEFNRAIHGIKQGVEGNPDMIFDIETGNVYDQRSGDLVGNLYDYTR